MFTQSPGFSEGLDLSLNANDRRAASRGMLNSGNTIADTTKLATDYASQKFGDYRAGLSPYLQQGTSAASGLSNIYTNLGDQTNKSYTGQGDLAYKTRTGIGDAGAAAELNNYNVSKNQFDLLMQGVKMATGMPMPSFGGGGGGFGNGTGAMSPGQSGWSNFGTGGTAYPVF